MGGNVQCPVCTLFLLPGMDLSDHLETHPKEQVIKALVQLSLKSEVAEIDTQDTPHKNSNLNSAENVNHSVSENDRTSPLSEKSGSGNRNNVALEIHQKNREVEDSSTISTGSRNVLLNRQCGYMLENNSGSSNSSSSNFFGPPTSYYHHQQQQQQQNHQQQPPPPSQPHHHNNHHHQNYYPFNSLPHGGGGGISAAGQGPGQPSMRLFSYPSQPKPLQPPPAYGAAISQLRSQNSQNLMGNNHVHRPHYSQENFTPTSSSSSSISSPTTTPARLPPPVPPPPLNQRYQSNFSQVETSFTDTSSDNNSMSPRRTTLTPPTRPPPHLYRSPITSAGQYLRQSSSPYSVMAGSPSVLRYAESPVTAHYLERENGDFIVQETPKHIVECVEKDDGEFSVIERLYHMPPSVVQINEDQEDDLSEHGSDTEEMKMLEDDRPSGTWSSERLPEQVQTSQHRSHKKSGITVLSDVQLDLNEYLDLMGNIIASSKTAKTRTEIVKVEKLEEDEVKDELHDESSTDEENPSAENGQKPEETSEDNIEHENISTCTPVDISSSINTNLTENPITAATTSVIRLAAHPSLTSNTPTFSKDLEEPMQTDNIEAHPTNTEEVLHISSTELHITKIEEAWPSWGTEIQPSKTEEQCLLPNINTTESDIKEDITEGNFDTASTKDFELVPTTSTQETESNKDFEIIVLEVPQLPLSEEANPAKIEMLDTSENSETSTKQTVQPIGPMPVKKEENLQTFAYQQSIKRPVKKAPKKLVIKPKSKVPTITKSHSTTEPRTTTPTPIIMPTPMQIATPTTSAETTTLEPHKEEILSEAAEPCQDDDLNSIKSENLQGSVAGSISAPLFADADEKLPPDDDVQPCTSIVYASEEKDALLASAADNKPTADLTAFFDQCLKREGEEVHPMHSIFGIEMGGATETISNTSSPPPPPRFPSSSLFPKPLTTSEHLSVSESVLPDNSDLMNHNQDHHEPQEQQQQQQNNSAYVEYPFSFLYGGEANQQEENKHEISPPMYCSEDFQRYSASTSGGNSASCTWYQSQSSENDFEIDGKGSYLDLDSCKRSVSFAAATEGSMPTSDALNIRTDEKMPAKGEISEQESNCGVENSWSQPLYNEFPVRSPMPYHNFMTNHESWSHDHYFRPQDLSSSVETKTFALRLTEESPVLDTLPSTSKRKNKTILKVPRKKSFQCAHCNTHFPLLKEKNAHLIKQHGYKRCNRRLIRDPPTSTVTTATMNTIDAGASLLLGLEPGALLPPPLAEEEDSKAGIVKMEQASQEQKDCEKEISSLTLATTVAPTSASLSRTKYDTLRARDNRLLITFNLNALNVKNEGEVHNHYTESKSSFCCFVCRRDFLTVKLFDEHLNEHPAECFTCHKKFTRWKNFIVHLKRHFGWKDFGCTFCEKKFVIRSALVEHMRMHTGQTPLKCKVCGKCFKRYSNLTQHRKRHGNKVNRTKEYVCYCGEVLPSKARFIWHKETHDLKPKCCPYCRDRFVHANSLRRHIRLAHSDKFDYTEPMECPMCKQIYAKSSIRAHMATHSMDTQHECLICNKSFSTKWNLKIHNWVHANRTTKPFKCDQCVKAFVREVDYNNHMNSHKQIKPYTCEHCGCKFIRKYNYIRHRREHHGNKKFTCDLCGKLFHRHYYLIEHRRIHTGERPFQCTICGKSSTTKTNHNKHLKIHHSRDPFTSEA